MNIKNRYTGDILIERKVETIKELVEIAISEEISLIEADIRRADLMEANLEGANLNCIFYRTKVTEKQKEQIINSDLFEIIQENEDRDKNS